MITDYCKQRILDAADCYTVISDFVDLKKRGSVYVGHCPFHNERSPSFTVFPNSNRFKCFGCQKSGDAVEFLMEHQNLSFPEALEWLAKRFNIEVKYEKRERTQEEIDKGKHREALIAAAQGAHNFFLERFAANDPEAIAARAYAEGRWGADFCKEKEIGFAPRGRAFLDYAKAKCLNWQALRELSLIDEGNNGQYAFFRERITMPIRNPWGKLIGFTARYLGTNPEIGKYMNSKESALYDKGSTLFGIDVAGRNARQSKSFILVEGAPDVLRLQAIGIGEAVAPLGTALTKGQLDLMRRYAQAITIIPDSDPPREDGAEPGFDAVMKNGKIAMQEGFEVNIREIPAQFEEVVDEKTGEVTKRQIKADPDSYFSDIEKYRALSEEPFVVWLAKRRFEGATTPALQSEVVTEIAALLVLIEDEFMRDMCVDMLCKVYGKKKTWDDARKREARALREKANVQELLNGFTQRELEVLRNKGIIIRHNAYFSTGKDGDLIRWSNFILRPKIHIKDPNNAIRIFSIVNEDGQEDIIILTSEDFVSLARFQKKLISLGNYVWRAKQDQLTTLQEYLFAVSESAEKVECMGWNEKEQYYAMANGLYIGGQFRFADPMGLVKYANKNYYIPAAAVDNAQDGKYGYERQYMFDKTNGLDFRTWAEKIIEVFGDGGKVGILWTLTSIFRSTVFNILKWFPIFFVFGQKGTGKSNLAMSLNSLFVVFGKQPPTMTNTTIAAMTYMLSHVVDGSIPFDEFTNELGDKKVDIQKGFYGGVAQTKMASNGDTQTPISSPVRCGVIMCGQFIPLEEAVFSRTVHWQYSNTTFDMAQKRSFDELKAMCSRCNTQIVFELLKHRETIAKGFKEMFDTTVNEIYARVAGEQIESRILDNWACILAVFRLLETVIDAPFTYKEMFDICCRGLVFQNSLIKKSSESSAFFKFVDAQHMAGRVVDGSHYVIKKVTSITDYYSKEKRVFTEPRRLVCLNVPAIFLLWEQRRVDSKTGNRMDATTLENYLKNLPTFVCRVQQRFNVLKPNGEVDSEFRQEGTSSKRMVKQVRPVVPCFDYDALQESLGLTLDTLVYPENFVDAEEIEPEPAKQTPPPPPSLFPPSNNDDEKLPF